MNFIILLLLSFSVLAQPVTTPEEVITQESFSTSDNRNESTGTLLVGYQLLTTWIPSKLTLSYTHIFTKKWSLEGEYAYSRFSAPVAGIDLGKISETRVTLQARYYPNNSFHFSFGPYFNDFEAGIGSSILNRLGTETTSSFGVEGLGLTGGIGNRWQWKNGFTLGVDWFRLNIPLVVLEVESRVLDDVDGDDYDDIRNVIEKFNRVPTFLLFGINVGYTF